MSKRVKASIQPDKEGFPWILLHDGRRLPWDSQIYAAISPDDALYLSRRLMELYRKTEQRLPGKGKHTVPGRSD